MKNCLHDWTLGAGLLSVLASPFSTTFAQGTAFTYQGRLIDDATPAYGMYDLRFAIYDAASGGTQHSNALTNSATSVTNGLFSVALDFGPGVFTGSPRWLDIAVRTNGSSTFVVLSPRQALTATPYAMAAANANSVAGSNITGTISAARLPASIVTNNASGVVLTGTFSGTFGVFSNLFLSSLTNGNVNRLRFTDAPGSERVLLHAKRNMDFETENDGTAWVGHDYTSVIDHDSSLHIRHDSTVTVDNNLAFTDHASVVTTIDGNLTTSVGGDYGLTANNANLTAANNVNLSANNLTTSVGVNQSSIVGGAMSFTVGKSLNLTVGQNLTLFPSTGVGIGTGNPQGSLHVYSVNNPTVVRIQSTGTPGFGRLEFVSNPQGDVNEWRPAYIQSLDAGGFTGGLGFYVNGTGAGNKFGSNEVMRIINRSVGVNKTSPVSALDAVSGATGNGVQGTCTNTSASGVYGENLTGGGYGVAGRASGTGVAVYGDNANASGWAGYFNGNVRITGTLNPSSDRNLKKDFQPIHPAEILEKVAALNIKSWVYTNDASASRHLGPVAQDFKAAFGLGHDDYTIATVDADGVALAAIQGLTERFEARSVKSERQLRELEAENAELKSRLANLEKVVANLNVKGN